MLPDLSGTWKVARRIIGENARFTGTLTFTPKGDDLIYKEQGTMRLPAAQLDAYRSYIYRPKGDALEILYDDGRPFLNLVFKDGVATDIHQRDPDVYRATFKIKHANELICAYAVTGPRKNYFSVSRLTRTI